MSLCSARWEKQACLGSFIPYFPENQHVGLSFIGCEPERGLGGEVLRCGSWRSSPAQGTSQEGGLRTQSFFEQLRKCARRPSRSVQKGPPGVCQGEPPGLCKKDLQECARGTSRIVREDSRRKQNRVDYTAARFLISPADPLLSLQPLEGGSSGLLFSLQSRPGRAQASTSVRQRNRCVSSEMLARCLGAVPHQDGRSTYI